VDTKVTSHSVDSRTISPERLQAHPTERPQVSVVIASVNGPSYLERCLASLSSQRGNIRGEVIVVDCYGGEIQDLVTHKYPWVKLLSFSERLTIPRLRAIGIAHSTGQFVAITEDHCIPADDWYERIVACLEGSYVAVGGAVENASTEHLVDWAVFLCEYYRQVNPIPKGEVDDVAGMNVAYKREALDGLQDLLAAGRWENFFHARLRANGFRLYSDPAMLIYHRKSFSVTGFLAQRFHYGRAFAGMRVDGATVSRRAIFGMGTVLLPPVLIGRIASQVVSRRRHRLVFLRCLPLLSLFVVSWAAGECVGYLAGPGDSLARVE
jgi:GT2 family glycosyltransferase